MFLSIAIFACEKEPIKEQGQSYTKEELIEIYTQYTDDEIGDLGIDIDQLIADNFSLEEQEELLIERVEFFIRKKEASI